MRKVNFGSLKGNKFRKVDGRIKYDDSPELLNFILTEVGHFVEGAKLPKTSIIDVGCGNGYVLTRVKELLDLLGRGCTLCAVDIDAAALSKAQAPIKTLNSDAADLKGVAGGSVNLYLSSFVMRYVESREKMVSEMSRTLSKGGRAVLLLWMQNSMLSKSNDNLYTLNLLNLTEFQNVYQAVRDGKRPDGWKEVYNMRKRLEMQPEAKRYRETLAQWEKKAPEEKRKSLAAKMERDAPAIRQAVKEDKRLVELDKRSFGSEEEIYALFQDTGLKIEKIECVKMGLQRFLKYKEAGHTTPNLAWGVVLEKN